MPSAAGAEAWENSFGAAAGSPAPAAPSGAGYVEASGPPAAASEP